MYTNNACHFACVNIRIHIYCTFLNKGDQMYTGDAFPPIMTMYALGMPLSGVSWKSGLKWRKKQKIVGKYLCPSLNKPTCKNVLRLKFKRVEKSIMHCCELGTKEHILVLLVVNQSA